jgi:hypothetical protein|tara:strand:+ start:19 stop:144 length:126 start_codon:yes stop_codon:yes gene_type:complete
MKFIPHEDNWEKEYYEKINKQRNQKKANKLRVFGTPKKKNK